MDQIMFTITIDDIKKLANRELELAPWSSEEFIAENGRLTCVSTFLRYPIADTDLYLKYRMGDCWCVCKEYISCQPIKSFLEELEPPIIEKEKETITEEVKEIKKKVEKVETVRIINAEILSSIEATVTVEDIETGETQKFRTANIDDYGYTVIPHNNKESDFRTRAIDLLNRKPVINSEFYCS